MSEKTVQALIGVASLIIMYQMYNLIFGDSDKDKQAEQEIKNLSVDWNKSNITEQQAESLADIIYLAMDGYTSNSDLLDIYRAFGYDYTTKSYTINGEGLKGIKKKFGLRPATWDIMREKETLGRWLASEDTALYNDISTVYSYKGAVL